jgi:hypothetical protein
MKKNLVPAFAAIMALSLIAYSQESSKTDKTAVYPTNQNIVLRFDIVMATNSSPEGKYPEQLKRAIGQAKELFDYKNFHLVGTIHMLQSASAKNTVENTGVMILPSALQVGKDEKIPYNLTINGVILHKRTDVYISAMRFSSRSGTTELFLRTEVGIKDNQPTLVGTLPDGTGTLLVYLTAKVTE